jgi:hypothetical protein
LIETAIVRKAFEDSGVSARDLAIRLGWYEAGRPYPDSQRVRRRLGLADYLHRDDGTFRPSRSMQERTAIAILDALGMAPVDVGL